MAVPAEEHAPDPERAKLMTHRYRAARRAGMDQNDSGEFAIGETPLEVLLLCVRRGATPEQIRQICL